MEIINFGISIGYFFPVKVKTVKTLILSLNKKIKKIQNLTLNNNLADNLI
jgi:hypothetical protein